MTFSEAGAVVLAMFWSVLWCGGSDIFWWLRR